jgi:hypothetical protein
MNVPQGEKRMSWTAMMSSRTDAGTREDSARLDWG